MPLYEYECGACHRRTEKIQKFSDPELTVCPFCGGPLARTVTAPAIQFKGAGWYKDLYSSAKPATNNGSGESAAAASSEGKSGESGGGAKSDTGAASPAAAAPASTPATTSSGNSTT